MKTLARELLALTKARITAMAVIVAAAAAWLAAPSWDALPALCGALAGVALVVAAANALNQYLERDGDALMERTRQRPLPAGRLAPGIGLAFGLTLAGVSLPLIAWCANLLTAGLAALALVNYVLVYTPLKRRTTLALHVGAVSGAMPVLMGWTAVTGRLDATGALLFAVLWLWQLPHFVAIAIFRRAEYVRAGIAIVPELRGDEAARRQCVAYATALVPLSLALAWRAGAGPLALAAALVASAGFLLVGLLGVPAASPSAWARRFFRASLVFPLALLGGLLLDAAL